MNEPTDPKDEILRRALRDEAGSIDPTPRWDDVRDRITRRPRRWLPAAAALLVIALVAGAALLIREDRQGDTGVVADDPATTTTEPSSASTTTDSTTTTTPAPSTVSAEPWTVAPGPDVPPLLDGFPAGEPLGEDEVVAAIDVPSDDEFPAIEVVVLSKETGDVVRTLATGYDIVEGGVYRLTLSPDRRLAFWVVSTAACTSRIEVAPVDGSGPAAPFRDDANGIAFGSGGSYAVETGDQCISPAEIEVGDTAGGPTTAYTAPDDRATTLESMALDEDHLAVVPSTSDAGSTGALHLVGRSSGEVAVVPPEQAAATFSGVHTGNDGRFVALEGCCGGPPYESASLVWLDAGEPADRRPLLIGRSYAATTDAAGDLLTIAGEEIGDLHVGGQSVRPDVYAIAT